MFTTIADAMSMTETWNSPDIPLGLDPWEFSDLYREYYHVDVLKGTFAQEYGFKPLLCVVRSKHDGVEYLKSFDIFAECENMDIMDAAESTRRARQYKPASLVRIESWFSHVFDEESDKKWVFVRVADGDDPVWGTHYGWANREKN